MNQPNPQPDENDPVAKVKKLQQRALQRSREQQVQQRGSNQDKPLTKNSWLIEESKRYSEGRDRAMGGESEEDQDGAD